MSVSRGCLTAALAAGAATAAAGPAEAQPQAHQSAAALSLGAKRDIQLGQAVRLSGRLTGVARRAGQRVELLADQHPYGDGYALAAAGTISATGTYGFTVRPQRNTRYRAQASGATTLVRTVFVTPRLGLGIYNRPGRRVELRAVVVGTPPLITGDNTVYFYFKASGSRIYHRVAVREITGPFGNVLRAVALIPAPSASRGTFLYCSKDPFIIGMGRPFLFRACGQLTAT